MTQPMQPVIMADDGVVRFKENAIVQFRWPGIDFKLPHVSELTQQTIADFIRTTDG